MDTVKCPKCGTENREVARFCTRCHATLRYECPSCHHGQRHGGICERCGVDFMKYINAVVAANKSQSDADHARLEQRSSLMKNLLFVPFTLGIPLIRSFLVGHKERR